MQENEQSSQSLDNNLLGNISTFSDRNHGIVRAKMVQKACTNVRVSFTRNYENLLIQTRFCVFLPKIHKVEAKTESIYKFYGNMLFHNEGNKCFVISYLL